MAAKYSTDAAVLALDKLAQKWPSHLGLFSWSGRLAVVRLRKDGAWPHGDFESHVVAWIGGIPNDGGDPD